MPNGGNLETSRSAQFGLLKRVGFDTKPWKDYKGALRPWICMIHDVAAERPLCRSPVSILIDDSSPGINPLYYYASTVPPDSSGYHYVSKGGEWYFNTDLTFHHPIPKTVDPSFVLEFAKWIRETEVKGKTSVVPYAAGLGRIDGEIDGVPRDQTLTFIHAISSIQDKFDVSSELLTHTRAVDLDSMKLMEVAEHDWSQKQTFDTLAPYVTLSLEMLQRAGLDPRGVTSPVDFGAKVEGDYAMAVLEAVKRVKGSGLAWYFLHVDQESQVVSHKLMYLNREAREAVVSIVASVKDPFWSSLLTDEFEGEWRARVLEPVLSRDGRRGRIAQQVASASWIALVTHWQTLYSNGTRYGLHALRELVRRMNNMLGDRIIWMSCSEVAAYVACLAASNIRVIDDGATIEVSSPFQCRNLTLSFRATHPVKKLKHDGKVLRRVNGSLSGGTWSSKGGKVLVSIPRLEASEGKYVARLGVS